jgi:hypothetical protein
MLLSRELKASVGDVWQRRRSWQGLSGHRFRPAPRPTQHELRRTGQASGGEELLEQIFSINYGKVEYVHWTEHLEGTDFLRRAIMDGVFTFRIDPDFDPAFLIAELKRLGI